MKTVEKEFLKIVKRSEKLNKASLISSLKHAYINLEKKPKSSEMKGFKVLLLNAPCMGFGDVVFAIKLATYINNWYPDAELKIATTKVDNFLSLGVPSDNLYLLKGKKQDQCRRFKNLELLDSKTNKSIPIPQFDLILVAPVQMDFDPSISDVKSLIPYANKFNTLFFSEYNDALDKDFDFHTGVGQARDGMLFTKTGKSGKKFDNLKNPYAVVYIAENVDRSDDCFFSFIKLLDEKYSEHHKKLDVVVPGWITKDIIKNKNFREDVLSKIKNYTKIFVKTKEELKDLTPDIKADKKTTHLTLRGDILPLPYTSMTNLYYHSLPDILITGDQSITDVLSCCWKRKLPSYQIVPWKTDFSKNLANHLPQKYLGSIRSSCGTLRSINYKPSFKKFMDKWDFRKRAKGKMNALIKLVLDMKNKENIREMTERILNL